MSSSKKGSKKGSKKSSIKSSKKDSKSSKSSKSTGMFSTNGNYIGGVMSIIYISVIIYFGYIFNKNIAEMSPTEKTFSIIGLVTGALFILTANGYYFVKRNKGSSDDKAKVKSRYAHITLSPLYLVLAIICLGFLASIFSTRKVRAVY